jgi:lambda family phage tail tape measure protein
MADLRYIVETDTRRAQQGLDQLNTKTNQSVTSMQSLGRVIAGLGFAAFVRNALQAANALTDLAAATDVSVQSAIALSRAFQENSGTFAGAQQAIERLTRVTGEAINGNEGARRSFSQLGISMLDLASRTPDELLREVVVSLGNMEDAATRSAIAMQLLGRQGATADLRAIGQEFDSQVDRAGSYSSAMANAGAANQQFANALQVLQFELLKAIQPITKFIAELTPEEVEKFTKSLKALGVALAIFLVVPRIIAGLKAFGASIAGLFVKIRKLTNQGLYIGFLRALERLVGNTKKIGALRTSFILLNGAISGVARALGGALLAGIAALKIPLGALLAGLYLINEGFKIFTNWKGPIKEFSALWRRFFPVDESKKFTEELKLQQKEADNLRKTINIAFGSQVQKNILDVADYINNIDLRGLRRELALLDIDAEFRPLSRALQQAADQFKDIERQILATMSEIIEADGGSGAGFFTEEYENLNKELLKTRDAYREQIELIKQLDAARRKEAKEAQDKLDLDNKFNTLLQGRIRLFETIEGISADGVNTVNNLNSEMAKLSMGTLQKQFEDIRVEQEAITESANAMVYSLYLAGNITFEEYRAALRDILALEEEITANRNAAAEELFNQQREFSTGWQQAFREYEEAATNSANSARALFETGTKGMEDALMNFVNTGKLSFRSLISDMIQQMLRLQMQKGLAALLGGLSGGAGGGLGAAFAGFFANGGLIPSGKFGVVGEAGPELISGPAQITPMDQINTGGSASVTYNINATDARSFKELVASDPGFIYAVTEKGRQTLPARRR